MTSDPWLNRWLPLLKERAKTGVVLEIGCGSGTDTATLADLGLTVHAFDLSESAVQAARLRSPSAIIECRDVRASLPIQSAEAVVASLSLHYFPWQETVAIEQRIRDVLRPNGVLLCRLNSTEDHHFGASGHPMIEPNYFLVDGQPKRFFDKASVEQLFNRGWRYLSLEHRVTDKYLKPKAAWEVVLERDA